MMIKTAQKLAILSLLPLSTPLMGATVFSHNFDSGTAGAVDNVSKLGAGTGTLSFEGSTYGFVSAGADQAFTSGNQGRNNSNEGTATFDADPGGNLASTPVSNRFYANFASAASIAGLNSVDVNFDVGGFGSSNHGDFKAMTVRGLSSSGDEVFEAWIGFGSANNTRFIYARGASDTTYTTTANNAGTPAGTLIYNNIAGNWNGTNTAAKPAGMDTLGISIANGQVTYSFSTGNAGGTLTFSQNSAATDLAQLEFASLNNITNQNAGFWLDNVVVESIPEPASSALFAVTLGLFSIVRRRR